MQKSLYYYKSQAQPLNYAYINTTRQKPIKVSSNDYILKAIRTLENEYPLNVPLYNIPDFDITMADSLQGFYRIYDQKENDL